MKKLLLTVCSLSLSACMGGEMTGRMSDGSSVVLSFDQQPGHDLYSTVIDGESFSGKAVMMDSSSSFDTGFGSANAFAGASTATAFGSASSFGYSTSGRYKAVLLGDRGNTLICLMHYADSSGFTTSGGVGECQHSDGRTMAVTW